MALMMEQCMPRKSLTSLSVNSSIAADKELRSNSLVSPRRILLLAGFLQGTGELPSGDCEPQRIQLGVRNSHKELAILNRVPVSIRELPSNSGCTFQRIRLRAGILPRNWRSLVPVAIPIDLIQCSI